MAPGSIFSSPFPNAGTVLVALLPWPNPEPAHPPTWTVRGWSQTSAGGNGAHAQPGTGTRGQPGQRLFLPNREDKEDMWVAAG